MKLTRHVDYSLRILIYLAIYPDQLTRIEELANAYKISAAHVAKIVHKLGQLGYLEVRRGRSGGVKLGRLPEEIGIAQVVRDFEPDLNLVECFNPETDTCPITPACTLKNILGEAMAAFTNVLEQYTLADLLVGKRSNAYRKALD